MHRLLSLLCMIIFIFITIVPVTARPDQHIYSVIVTFKKYVVGRDNVGSGLHRYESDTTWTHLGWRNTRAFGIALNPQNPRCIFLAGGNGLMRSLDGGQSWRITTDWQITEVLDVCTTPFDSEQVFIATAYGVWRTPDRGESWTKANNGLDVTFVQTIESDSRTPNRILVGGEGGLYVSENGAQQWKTVALPHQVAIRDLHQCAVKPQLWLAGTEDKVVLRSSDNGQSWQFATGKIARQTIYAVAIDPLNPQNMAAGGFQTGVFVSTDGGKKWHQTRQGLGILDVHALVFDQLVPGRLWVGTLGGGIYYSDNFGKNWIYAGLNGGEIWDMLIVKDK